MGKTRAVQALSDIGIGEAEVAAARLRVLLPPELAQLIDFSFVRSHLLYEEFVYRLVLRVIHEVGLEATLRDRRKRPRDGAAGGARGRAGSRATRLDAETTSGAEDTRGGSRRGPTPVPGAAAPCRSGIPLAVREEQSRHDGSWMPSYVLAETVAQEYPAFLRGEVPGEEVLFSPRRLRLWIDYFSNGNRLYAAQQPHRRPRRRAVDASRRWSARLSWAEGWAAAPSPCSSAWQVAGRLDAIREYRFTEFVPAFLRRGSRRCERVTPNARLSSSARWT